MKTSIRRALSIEELRAKRATCNILKSFFANQFLKNTMASKCCHNYQEETETLVNKQINIELNAYYQYLAMVIKSI